MIRSKIVIAITATIISTSVATAMDQTTLSPTYTKSMRPKPIKTKQRAFMALVNSRNYTCKAIKNLLGTLDNKDHFTSLFLTTLDKNNNTIMHKLSSFHAALEIIFTIAAEFKDPDLIKNMIFIKNKHSETPLIMAFESNNIENVSAFLRAFKNIRQRDRATLIPADILLKIACTGHKVAVSMIKELFPDASQEIRKRLCYTDQYGNSAFHYAVIYKMRKTLEALLDLSLKIAGARGTLELIKQKNTCEKSAQDLIDPGFIYDTLTKYIDEANRRIQRQPLLLPLSDPLWAVGKDEMP